VGGRARRRTGFTLVEVLAALLFMAIVIPVAMHGVTVASRAGILGMRKTAAMRIAERVLEESIVTGEITNGAGNGTITEGTTTYPWTMTSQPWTEDTMTEVIVHVSFDVQGNTYDVSLSTLYDPTVGTVTAGTTVATP
jgi:type II secretory pathway pseudopilin PulG